SAGAGSNRPDRKTESESSVLVAQLHPRAEREDLLLPSGQLAQHVERLLHPPLVVDPLLGRRREVRLRLGLRKSAYGGGEASLGAAAVAEDVHGDAVEPWQHVTVVELLVAAAPSLEKDDRKEIIGSPPGGPA